MKKIITVALIIAVILGGALFIASKLAIFTKSSDNIVAKVNGVPITLDEIEALYDMQHVQINTAMPSVQQVQKEYAQILYARIKQILVANELKKRNATVTNEEVNALEEVIKDSYYDSVSDNNFAQEVVDKNGINYEEWKKQLRVQLENVKLEELLLKDISISSEETMKYAEKIQNEQKGEYAKIDFIKIIAKPEELQKILSDNSFTGDNGKNYSEEAFIEKYEKDDVVILKSLFDSESLPEEYKAPLREMAEYSFSPIITKDKESYILYLINKENNKEENDPVDLYLLAEEKLVQDKLPEIYSAWLESAIKSSKITIVDSFNPKNFSKQTDTNKIQTLKEALQEIE